MREIFTIDEVLRWFEKSRSRSCVTSIARERYISLNRTVVDPIVAPRIDQRVKRRFRSISRGLAISMDHRNPAELHRRPLRASLSTRNSPRPRRLLTDTGTQWTINGHGIGWKKERERERERESRKHRDRRDIKRAKGWKICSSIKGFNELHQGETISHAVARTTRPRSKGERW